jgi:hypothetical protein
LVLVGFLCSFGFIRLSTRLMRSPRVPRWPGSVVSDSGVRLHHLVFGIVLMGASGMLGFWFFDSGIWMELSALLFGIGIGLTIDEVRPFHLSGRRLLVGGGAELDRRHRARRGRHGVAVAGRGPDRARVR